MEWFVYVSRIDGEYRWNQMIYGTLINFSYKECTILGDADWE